MFLHFITLNSKHTKLLLMYFVIFNTLIYSYIYAVIYTIEFQKRGLPHAHILVFLKDRTLCMDPSLIDKFISAEIRDKDQDLIAYAAVENYMIHGPCGEVNKNSVCMEDNKCTKHFPKAFNAETIIDEEGFPIYRRRNDDSCVKKRKY
jgi:hypothetical protein